MSWKVQNNVAEALIIQKIDENTFLEISHLKSAKQIWEAIKRKYGAGSRSRKFDLLADLFDFSYDVRLDGIEGYINRFRKIELQLSEIFDSLPKEIFQYALLRGLQKTLKHLEHQLRHKHWGMS